MSDILYFIILINMSPRQVDIIFNKVTVEQYKKHEVGVCSRKSYTNSKSDFFGAMYSDMEGFSEGQHSSSAYFNLSGENTGFLLETIKSIKGVVYTEADIKSYAASKKIDIITDAVYASFLQDKIDLHIERK